MAQVDVNTTLKKKEDNYVLEIVETQTMTEQELQQNIYERKAYKNQITSQLNDAKSKLVKVMDLEDDEEVKKFVEMSKKSEQLKEKEALTKNIKGLEIALLNIDKHLATIEQGK